MKQYRMCLKGVGEVTAAKAGCLSMKELTGMVKAMQEKEKAQEKLVHYFHQQKGGQEKGCFLLSKRAPFSDEPKGGRSVPRHGDIYETSEM